MEDGSEITSIWDEARSHTERGNYDNAIEIYRYILVRYADNPFFVELANAYLGDIYLTIRNFGLAEKYLKKAITYDAVKPHYHYLLGFTYSINEQWTKAVKEFSKATNLEPLNGEYERGFGWAILNSGDKMKGLAHLYRARELSPSNVHILTDLGTAMLILGNTEKAREYGEEALRRDPSYTLAQSFLEIVSRVEKRE